MPGKTCQTHRKFPFREICFNEAPAKCRGKRVARGVFRDPAHELQ